MKHILFLKTLLFFTLISGVVGLLAAEVVKTQVAVLSFETVGDDAKLGEGAAEILRTSLAETGQYTIVERGMLKQVLEEQKLNLSGAVDQKEATGIGKLLGAQLVAVGSVVKFGESYTLNIRFVNVDTGEVVFGKKLTASNKEEIPALCGQMVQLLSSGKTSPIKKRSVPGEWAVGLVYPGGAVKYLTSKHAWELKAQSGSGILAAGPRYYRYLLNSNLRLFWGLEGDFISFKGEESKGLGFAAGGFAGGEILLGKNLGLSMDFGPMFISLNEDDYSQSESGIEYVINMALYWHFR